MIIDHIEVEITIRFVNKYNVSVGGVKSPFPTCFSDPNQLLQFRGAFPHDVTEAGKMLKKLKDAPEEVSFHPADHTFDEPLKP